MPRGSSLSAGSEGDGLTSRRAVPRWASAVTEGDRRERSIGRGRPLRGSAAAIALILVTLALAGPGTSAPERATGDGVTLHAPSNGASFESTATIHFEWSEVWYCPGCDGTVMVFIRDAGGSPVWTGQGTCPASTEPSCPTFVDLMGFAPGSYTWYVRVKLGENSEHLSDTWGFTVTAPAPPPPPPGGDDPPPPPPPGGDDPPPPPPGGGPPPPPPDDGPPGPPGAGDGPPGPPPDVPGPPPDGDAPPDVTPVDPSGATPTGSQPAPAVPAVDACVIPNVRGATLARARKMLDAARCKLGKVSRRYSARVARGRVVAQRPGPGVQLGAGAAVSVVLSRGRR